MSAATLTRPTSTYDLSPGKLGSEQPTLQAVSASSEERPVLVIGDIHGHLDRLEALLKQEGLLVQCEECDGLGQTWEPCPNPSHQDFCPSGCKNADLYLECAECEGDGWRRARTRKRPTVVLVGDIGHFGRDGSPTGDLLTWLAAVRWADVILWGNHDRAIVESQHEFTGYLKPNPEVYHVIARARAEGKLKLAHAAHGFLITHAGLHAAFAKQPIDDKLKTDPVAFAEWINEIEDPNAECTQDQMAIRDAVARKRGGASPGGGILWRDIDEKLYDGFRQVFGHSASRDGVVRYASKTWYSGKPGKAPKKPSYCIDIGGKNEQRLAGIWLPDEKVVRVDL